MAERGDSYIVSLKRPHLEWGVFRHTDSRGTVFGEGYIQIPAEDAYRLNLLNQNGTGYNDIFGKNLFNCRSADGRFEGVLRAQGNQSDERYAKQFAGDKNLKALGDWFFEMGACVDDEVSVTWISDTDIEIELIKNS